MTNHTTLDRLAAQCREIADELEAAHDGDLFEDEDGDLHIIRDESEPDDFVPVLVSDYLGEHCEVLDADATVNLNGGMAGARFYVCLGGPTVWIDTLDGSVRGHWGGDRSRAGLTSGTVDALDCLAAAMFEGVRIEV